MNNQILLLQRYITAMVVTLLAASTSQATDLKIYGLGQSDGAIMLVVDGSGSMEQDTMVSTNNNAGPILDDLPRLDPSSQCNIPVAQLGVEVITSSSSVRVGSRYTRTENIKETSLTSPARGLFTYIVNGQVVNNVNANGFGSTARCEVRTYQKVRTNCLYSSGSYTYCSSPVTQNAQVLSTSAPYDDRIMRLKKAVLSLVEDKPLGETRVLDRFKVGVVKYSNVDLSGQHTSGRVLMEALPMSDANNRHRLALIIAGVQGSGGTPTFAAYAEATAYLLGRRINTINGYPYGFSNSIASSKSGTVYAGSPSSCAPSGIMILTDGDANNADSTEANQQIAMTQATGANIGCSASMAVAGSDSGWRCMGGMAKYLRMQYPADTLSKQNRTVKEIKTGLLAFGNIGQSVNPTNCAARAVGFTGTLTATAQNMCKLGARQEDFGKGGFVVGSSEDEVKDAIEQFANNLGATSPVSTGVIKAPADPYNLKDILNAAFMPLLVVTPPAQNKRVWPGNIKRYALKLENAAGGASNNGSLDTMRIRDKQGLDIFDLNAAGSSYLGLVLGGRADVWNTTNPLVPDSHAITQGGLADHVAQPIANGGIRRLYLEEGPDATSLYPNGALTLVPSSAVNASYIQPTSTASIAGLTAVTGVAMPKMISHIYNYLGYDVRPDKLGYGMKPVVGADDVEIQVNDATTLQQVYKDGLRRYMGAALHTDPLVLPISATFKLDAATNKYKIDETTRKYSLLFGTSDGVLHIVSQDGDEQAAIIPRAMQIKQIDALSQSSTGSNIAYGMDGQWVADIDNNTISATGEVKVKSLSVYGGMGRSGNAIYAYTFGDPTNLAGTVKSKWVFTSPQMGLTLAKPRVVKIKYKGNNKKVVVVSGGYDACYDDAAYKVGNNCNATIKSDASGSVIYILDADTGAVIYTIGNREITDSVVATVEVFDRGLDGIVDHLYVGDLGANLWRVDLFTDKHAIAGSASYPNPRLVKMANFRDPADTTGKLRFFATPVFTYQQYRRVEMGQISIASGNLGLPTDVLNTDEGGQSGFTGVSNGVFSLWDRDVSRSDFYTRFPSTVTAAPLKMINLTRSNMTKDPTVDASRTPTTAAAYMKPTGSIHGWYRLFTESVTADQKGGILVGSYSNLTGAKKSFKDLKAVNNLLITSVYDAAFINYDKAKCFTVRGRTFADFHCLPFGTCGAWDSNNKDYVSLASSTDAKSASTIKVPWESHPLKSVAVGNGIADVVVKGGVVGNSSTDINMQDLSSGKLFSPNRWYFKLPQEDVVRAN